MINFSLSVDETNVIINALAQRPYIEVATLLEKIRNIGQEAYDAQQATLSANSAPTA